MLDCFGKFVTAWQRLALFTLLLLRLPFVPLKFQALLTLFRRANHLLTESWTDLMLA
jgi:hypothetical protein